MIAKFPDEIQDFAKLFVDMQKKRHGADYDPDATATYDPNMAFSKSNVIQDILASENVIKHFSKLTIRDRRAFAVYVLLDIRMS